MARRKKVEEVGKVVHAVEQTAASTAQAWRNHWTAEWLLTLPSSHKVVCRKLDVAKLTQAGIIQQYEIEAMARGALKPEETEQIARRLAPHVVIQPKVVASQKEASPDAVYVGDIGGSDVLAIFLWALGGNDSEAVPLNR